MATVKNNRTRTGIALFLFFLFGAFLVVNAMEKNRGEREEKQVETKKADELYTFEYNGPDFSKANVEDESHWSFTPSTELCDGLDERPCRIQVSAAYVDNPNTSPSLKPSANISASLNSGTNTHYVDAIADAAGVISNMQN
ncbi:hypothetical protein [Sphingobacterium chuzhouense]|uniref:Uncharacterized protein n=1 Tax=Sphingobacterium chuzhouense TaxID=1742264 RepID=A0ABR7XPA3_9SPHI|nr:hypothetical protein [Sphingobacterium chuzhouense]MBD1420998.1 hypothetical protein [Sphingobacterium chuzhouense]